MSDYRDEVSHYKAKRIGQVDAKVVAPKGRKKKVDKPWCVTLVSKYFPQWGPWKHDFAKEHDARAFYRKKVSSNYYSVTLEHDSVVIEKFVLIPKE